MKSPESHSTGSLGKILDAETIIKETDKKRINIDSFRGSKFYEVDEIDADLHQCQEIDSRIKSERKNYTPEKRAQYERGLAAEYTFRNAIEKYGWLADQVNLIVTSEYDDFVRGIDSIAQIITGLDKFEHLGFAIDFATGSEDVGNKIRRTFDAIDQGFTPSIKYFESEKTGKLKNFKVPRIVIGSGPETLERLATYSSEVMNSSDAADSAKKSIREDPFRAVLFGEIEAQLSVFINRLQKVVDQAKKEKRDDIEHRANSSLVMHKKALTIVQELAKKAGINMETIQKNIRGDLFAVKMGQALSVLSLTPIEFRGKKV
jgi:hypothetical protein